MAYLERFNVIKGLESKAVYDGFSVVNYLGYYLNLLAIVRSGCGTGIGFDCWLADRTILPDCSNRCIRQI